MTTIRNLAVALALMIALNERAFACAACFGASTPGALRAYYISTILLSLMPFVLIAVFVFLVRRYRLGGGASSRRQQE
jgi:hypothetical protein